MNQDEIDSALKEISTMTHVQMARLYRFSPIGDPLFDKSLPIFNAFMERFKAFGGFTPAISKEIGWKSPVEL
jgi:hypothetical protein